MCCTLPMKPLIFKPPLFSSLIPPRKSGEFCSTWSRIYLGPPDFIRLDQDENLTADLFVSSAVAEGIEVLEAPTECPTTMSHVECYHAPLPAAYQKIRSDFGFEPDEALELQSSV
jgi:hypothetical protein